jgi:hypothetical protein
MPASGTLYRIVAPQWQALVKLVNGVIEDGPPHAPQMKGWSIARVRSYCTLQGWRLARLNPDGTETFI